LYSSGRSPEKSRWTPFWLRLLLAVVVALFAAGLVVGEVGLDDDDILVPP
jgi:hypothetical protein